MYNTVSFISSLKTGKQKQYTLFIGIHFCSVFKKHGNHNTRFEMNGFQWIAQREGYKGLYLNLFMH